MTRDLEATLSELGPAYRAVVNRLTDAVEPSDLRTCRQSRWRTGLLAAASLVIVLALGVLFRESGASTSGAPASGSAVRPNEYHLASLHTEEAVAEMIRTQNADGSWKNDFLTRRNSEALRLCSSVEARIAYKKARRNLRARGLL